MPNSKPLIVEHGGYRAEIYQTAPCQFTIHYFDPENGDLGPEQKEANSAEALAHGSVKTMLLQLAEQGTRARS